MTTEISEVEKSSPNGSAAAHTSVAEAPQPSRPSRLNVRVWRQRRFQVVAISVAAILLVAALANSVLASQYTPEGAVRQYLSALQSGNAAAAWSQIQVSAPTQPATATLIDQAAFKAALAAARPDIKSFNVSGATRIDSSTQSVALSYDTAGGSKQAKFIVQQGGEKSFGLYPLWHLIIVPTILQVTLPAGSGAISIDGKALALPTGNSTIALLPLTHTVQIGATQVLAAQTVSVDAFFAVGQTLNYQPKLTAAGLAMASQAVKAGFDKCALRTDPNAALNGCPQAIDYSMSGAGQWTVVGDPTQDMVVSFDNDMHATGAGHYQMVFGHQISGTHGIDHAPASGGYNAALVLGTDTVTVASIDRAEGLSPITRPGSATDEAAKSVVGPAFRRCAAVLAADVADCPQALLSIATNVRWKLVGDPLANATVNFDPSTGQITVQGNFNMTVSYLFLGYPKTDSSFTSKYVAYLFWNGQSVQLVTIAGSN
jgi:hypothetical protein